ncbi:hypothetical protein RFI_25845 [Reticulomyxa filosa]|uniref:Uncharacterized protein n=1 Tax=Reticulomyxa filosa TaxID=46433 RepID=X6MCY6_RETFI|nr:hypothetical protein RFI_25845 [Reticulomyxa filosa]|eukprot:ETO11531.1 hypothetical protein RFI_25845 [Reticulomyxa filosa]
MGNQIFQTLKNLPTPFFQPQLKLIDNNNKDSNEITLLSFGGEHKHTLMMKYVSVWSNDNNNNDNEMDKSKDIKIGVRLWDIRSGQQIQVFNGHTNWVWAVAYSPFVLNNDDEVVGGNSNVICSGSMDRIIRFWDIRSNKNELYVINGDNKHGGIYCLTFLQLKGINSNDDLVSLCYGLYKGTIHIWG